MAPARLGRILLGAAIMSTLAGGIATAAQAAPAMPKAAGATPMGSYSRLLTAPLYADATTPALESSGRAVVANTSPCRHNQQGQLVLVSITRQHLWTCSRRHVVLSTPVTTGKSLPGDETPRGTFAVEARMANTTLHPANGNKVHVTYWIPFKQNVWGFHDAPWQSMPYGSSRYRTEGSIGCIHVPLAALRRLFDFVHPGTTVRIR